MKMRKEMEKHGTELSKFLPNPKQQYARKKKKNNRNHRNHRN